jgi:hypothetical protein
VAERKGRSFAKQVGVHGTVELGLLPGPCEQGMLGLEQAL